MKIESNLFRVYFELCESEGGRLQIFQIDDKNVYMFINNSSTVMALMTVKTENPLPKFEINLSDLVKILKKLKSDVDISISDNKMIISGKSKTKKLDKFSLKLISEGEEHDLPDSITVPFDGSFQMEYSFEDFFDAIDNASIVSDDVYIKLQKEYMIITAADNIGSYERKAKENTGITSDEISNNKYLIRLLKNIVSKDVKKFKPILHFGFPEGIPLMFELNQTNIKIEYYVAVKVDNDLDDYYDE